MQYFVRYIDQPEHARDDLERGYSFELYIFFQTEAAAVADAAEYGFCADDVAQNSNGKWGYAAAGLFAARSFDTLEEAREYALTHSYGVYTVAAIFAGESLGYNNMNDEMFRPVELIEVIE